MFGLGSAEWWWVGTVLLVVASQVGVYLRIRSVNRQTTLATEERTKIRTELTTTKFLQSNLAKKIHRIEVELEREKRLRERKWK